MNIEAKLNVPRGNEFIQEAVKLLGESSCELLGSSADALDALVAWLERNNTERFTTLKWSSSSSSSPSKDDKVSKGVAPVKDSAPKVQTGSAGETDEEKAEESEKERRVLGILEAQAALKAELEKFKDSDRYAIVTAYYFAIRARGLIFQTY